MTKDKLGGAGDALTDDLDVGGAGAVQLPARDDDPPALEDEVAEWEALLARIAALKDDDTVVTAMDIASFKEKVS